MQRIKRKSGNDEHDEKMQYFQQVTLTIFRVAN
jgi:hypothetical protein